MEKKLIEQSTTNNLLLVFKNKFEDVISKKFKTKYIINYNQKKSEELKEYYNFLIKKIIENNKNEI